MTTSEDKFFGIMAPVTNKGVETPAPDDNEDIEVQIVDDLPKKPESGRPAAKPQDEDDDELAGYSEKVRKRIAKLKFQQHEADRQREAAEKLREEAISYARQLAERNQQYEQLIQRGEGALVSQIKTRAQLQLEQAKSRYKEAYEAGDTDKILAAQDELLTATTELREAEKHERTLQGRKPAQPATPAQPAQPTQPQAPTPSKKALEWAERNPWFGPKGNKEMTALAYGIHERLVRDEGIAPDTDEYYTAIDEAIQARFPEHFEQEPAQTRKSPQRTPSAIVAPAKRSNGTSPRRIQLTATQVSLAKRLGLTPEQYAKQLLKESNNG
jgi:hypothetical protein